MEPPAAKDSSDEGGRADLGAAIPVALPRSAQVADVSPAPSRSASVADTHARATSGPGSPPLLLLVVCGLVLLYAGGRLLFGPVEPELFRSGRFERVRRVLSRV